MESIENVPRQQCLNSSGRRYLYDTYTQNCYFYVAPPFQARIFIGAYLDRETIFPT